MNIKQKKLLKIYFVLAIILTLGLYVESTSLFMGSIYFAGGEGTAENPYQISTVQELQNIEQDLDAYYILTNNIDASETLTWNGGSGFVPLGIGTDNFEGTLDGQGYKIIDFYMNRPDDNYVGLFDLCLEPSRIKNIGFENVSVTGYSVVGVVSGYQRSTSVFENIYIISGEVNDNPSEGVGQRTGSIVGDGRGTLINCYSNAEVTGDYVVGALIGYDHDVAVVTDCYWNIDLTNQTSSDGGGTGLTDAEMKNQANFVNWDFNNYWYMDTYPVLYIRTTPDAEFTVSNENATVGDTVTFTDTTTCPNSFDSRTWKINGELQTTNSSLEYTFDSNINYVVTLEVTDVNGITGSETFNFNFAPASSSGGGSSTPVAVEEETVEEETTENPEIQNPDIINATTNEIEDNSEEKDNDLIYIGIIFVLIAGFGLYIARDKK